MSNGPGLTHAQSATLQELDTEGFMKNPAPPLRLADLPAAYEAAQEHEPCTPGAKAKGCSCRPSPTRDAAKRVGLPWWFGAQDCPVHGGSRR